MAEPVGLAQAAVTGAATAAATAAVLAQVVVVVVGESSQVVAGAELGQFVVGYLPLAEPVGLAQVAATAAAVLAQVEPVDSSQVVAGYYEVADEAEVVQEQVAGKPVELTQPEHN